ncbi:hypothetical protein LZQ00_15795 [Sphingobacterium sp. SRCM116780]|uniref:hypothetical protein n=1 Tax=Sphingobacterium sp. SRCM116780 TaxID=2907623 RepID=UPI001F1CA7DE|nr:hypothetical protein [Sphingobacterium sp. SRCM116780]UIR55719.1 hypothetical protein LZQ00_15795 [Sphingobacterium sp. SRCM116780]
MKNNLGLGLLLGAIAPAVAYLLATYTQIVQTWTPQKPMMIYGVAVFINLIAMRFLFKGGKDAVAKGILMITFIATILYIFTNRLSI